MPFSQEFPQDQYLHYLNHAAVSPWPRRSSERLIEFARENTHLGAKNYLLWLKAEKHLRQQLCQLINAPSSDDIALLKNTSEALSVVAWGLDWQAGDEIIISDEEFPSNRIVWQSLCQQFDVKLVEVNLHSESSTPEQALIAAMNENTRLLAISSVQYASGLRIDLEPLGQQCQQKQILFLVDAIQSIGAVQFDVQKIQADFVMADGHKWMMGPEGLALFYCRESLREQLKLYQYGWHMVEEQGNYDKRDWQAANNARRFECGSPNFLGIFTLSASLSLLLEVGMDKVESLLAEKVNFMLEIIEQQEKLYLYSKNSPQQLAGIVSFGIHDADHAKIYQQLMQHNVICALRHGYIRFSPHFYTPRETIQKAFEHLPL